MFERAYRQRLDDDLTRWQADGVISADAGAAIRNRLGPLPKGIDLATVVAIVGGLLIAAAFLAFIAANWSAIARPARFAILLAGIAAAFGIAAWFDRIGRPILADLGVAAGSIIFGAAIALVGQMYHLSGDFAAGLLLWAIGALVAAALTGSRGALAVALVVGCVWSGARIFDGGEVLHLPFVAFWCFGAGLAIAWNAPVARHSAGAAAVTWWWMTGIGNIDWFQGIGHPAFTMTAGAALLVGAGMALASRGPPSVRAFGATLSTYGAFGLAGALAVTVAGAPDVAWRNLPDWTIGCAIAAVVLSGVAIGLSARRGGPAFAALSITLALVAVGGWARPGDSTEPWLSYALALAAMLSLVVSGMLDRARARMVAGWIGLAGVIAAITWAVKGSLLGRAAFLAVAGLVAIGLAIVLGRVMPEEGDR